MVVWYSTPFSTDKHNSATLQHTHCVLLYSLHFTSIKFVNKTTEIEFKTLHEYYQKHWYPNTGIHSTTRRCVSACGQGQVVGILAPGSLLQPLLTCQLITPMFVSMQCDEQSLESAENTTHHLGKPLVLIYEV